MPRVRSKITGEELSLHDGTDPVAFRPTWNFTGGVNASDDSGNDQTVVEMPGGSGLGAYEGQWIQYYGTHNPSTVAFPYRLPIGASAAEGSDLSFIGGSTNPTLGLFYPAFTGLYSINLRVSKDVASFPASPCGYNIYDNGGTNAVNTAPTAILKATALGMLIGCQVQFCTWLAAGVEVRINLVTGSNRTSVPDMDTYTHIARLL